MATEHIIDPKMLMLSVYLLEKQREMVKAAKEMVAACEAKVLLTEEFIRANYTGDDKGLDMLKEPFMKNTGSFRRLYAGDMGDIKRTARVVDEAIRWANARRDKNIAEREAEERGNETSQRPPRPA